MGDSFWRVWFSFGLLTVAIGALLFKSGKRNRSGVSGLLIPGTCYLMAVATWLAAGLIAVRYDWLFILVLKLQLIAWVPLLLSAVFTLRNRRNNPSL